MVEEKHDEALTVKLKKMKMIMIQYLSERDLDKMVNLPKLELTQFGRWAVDEICLCAVVEVYGHDRQIQVISYPSNWWEAVKDRFFPPWLKRRFPVCFTKHTITARQTAPLMALRGSEYPIQILDITEVG